MNEQIAAGFTYLVEVVKDGLVVDSEVVRNLIPTEGLDHIINVTLNGGAQNSAWYVGLFEGNYTPIPSDTAATFPAVATECTAYSETSRQAWTGGSIVTGSVSNSASRAEFTSTTNKTVYGGFVTSASAKGGTTGTLISVVRFSSPKTFDSGSVLRVTAGFTMTSV